MENGIIQNASKSGNMENGIIQNASKFGNIENIIIFRNASKSGKHG
jgi:hypothetical protein